MGQLGKVAAHDDLDAAKRFVGAVACFPQDDVALAEQVGPYHANLVNEQDIDGAEHEQVGGLVLAAQPGHVHANVLLARVTEAQKCM